LGDLLAIVVAIVCEAAAGVIGRGGDPDIARAVLVEHPGNCSSFGCGSEVRRKGRAHYLVERETSGRRRERERSSEEEAE